MGKLNCLKNCQTSCWCRKSHSTEQNSGCQRSISKFFRFTVNARKTESNRGNSWRQSKWRVLMRHPTKIGRNQEDAQLVGGANTKPCINWRISQLCFQLYKNTSRLYTILAKNVLFYRNALKNLKEELRTETLVDSRKQAFHG